MKSFTCSICVFILAGILLPNFTSGALFASTTDIGLYRTFEKTVENSKSYFNKFSDVELRCSYASPTGKKVDFFGFFDGDGNGGGNAGSGNVWKIRFMPDEAGVWKYTWSWSDGTSGGEGTFSCVATGAGKGILRAYEKNPRWFAYNYISQRRLMPGVRA
ncbi:MAG: DUF5060 domain-containing protein [Chitinispirillaceae bacterium]|nr:DUF5060 domain-containing protein [Chitinispirillaceae bacterium]